MSSKIGRYRQQAHHDLLPVGTKIARNPDGNGFRLEPSHGRFFPWERGYQTRDSANIGANVKQQRALSPDALTKITAAMVDVGNRITALENARRQPLPLPVQSQKPARDQQPLAEGTLFREPDGSVVFVPNNGAAGFMGFPGAPSATPQSMNFVPTPQTLRTKDARHCACGKTPCACNPQPTKDAPMTRNPNLAPLQNVTFNKPKTRDQNNFGEKPSRFTAQVADRMARALPSGSAGLPARHEFRVPNMKNRPEATLADMNKLNEAVHRGVGASGQMRGVVK